MKCLTESLRWTGSRRNLLSAALVVLGCLSLSAAQREKGDLCVITYNLRFASATPPNAWPDRRQLMGELIRSAAPDVMGTQEGLYQQLQELATDLPGYAWTGVGRDGGTNGEFMAVFYRKDRLQPLATNHFWLSDTPDTVATTSWGNKLNRMVTWLKFLDRETKREFYFFNTHFDHQSQVSREKSAELLRQRVSALPEKLPVVLTGDFNAISGKNKTYEILLREDFFKDTWHLAKTRKAEEYNSFTAFKEPGKEGLRIDWIFVRGDASVDSTEILPFSRNGQFPSDHFPVVARLTFGN